MASNNHVEEAPPAAHPAAPTAEPSPTERPDTPWRMIAVSAVRANPHQPRRVMDEAALAELADSIKTNGIIQPIVVRLNGNEYELIAGERRLRAAKLANLTEVPALVRQADAYSQAQLALVENIHRTDLNPIERAQAYQSLLDQLGLTQAELATRLGEQRSSVANFLRLLSLTEATRTLLQAGRLTLGHAKILAGISDTMEQERLAQLCADQELTVRNLERLIDPNAPQPTPKALPTQTPAHLKALEASFTQQIGLRVQVKAAKKKGRGRLVIHYNTLDQFDHLTKRLGVNVDDDAS
ncbi:MAG TPA: ParB/RepB/Spo0J family partition protein [Tepidisphaeraceae bacterium]|jgi:ParB family chromosome partitioning protein